METNGFVAFRSLVGVADHSMLPVEFSRSTKSI